jgi:hypothetical protein
MEMIKRETDESLKKVMDEKKKERKKKENPKPPKPKSNKVSF